MVSKNSESRLNEFDSLRGLAALFVCFFHFDLSKYGCTGVDLFFMISGFVIYMSVNNSRGIKQFALGRFIRLYPAYWLSIIIAIISFFLSGYRHLVFNTKAVLGTALMLQPIFRSPYWVDAYWTLYVELSFYLFIVLLCIFKQIRHIERIIVFGFVGATAFNLAYMLMLNTDLHWRFAHIVNLFPIISHFHLFAAGMLFYRCKTEGFTPLRYLLIAVSLLLVAFLHPVAGIIHDYINAYQHFICCLIFYATFWLITKSMGGFLNQKFLVLLGEISYVIYLIHQSFGIGLMFVLAKSIPKTLAAFVGIGASLLLSYIINSYFDVPVRVWLRNMFIGKKQPDKFKDEI